MSTHHGQTPVKGRKFSRNSAPDTNSHKHAVKHMNQPTAFVQQSQAPYYMPSSHSGYYVSEPTSEQQPYMLPYTPYQQPIQYHVSPQFGNGINQALAFQQQMPPLKRPRTEMRNVSSSSSIGQLNELRRNGTASGKAVVTRNAPPRKTFSDFRISTITIGDWFSDELKDDSETRNSKIRFCFRNATDKDAPSTLSATEAALITPDRLSISVLHGSRRIVIPAHHIKNIEFKRRAGEIKISTDGWAAFESLVTPDATEATTNKSLPRVPPSSWVLTEDDITAGQLSLAKEINIKLDLEKPLTEPKWTRGNLEEYIDQNSRFLHITKILDGESIPKFDEILEIWAGRDPDKVYFSEFQLHSNVLLRLLTRLMSASNILTPAVTSLLQGMMLLIQNSNIATTVVIELLKNALMQIPEHMLMKSLDTLHLEWEATEPASVDSDPTLLIESSFVGSKRQRGESEVPSDQLAKTTLDEKRRRLSDSEPQVPVFRNQVSNKAQSVVRGRTRVCSVDKRAPPMLVSKSQDSVPQNQDSPGQVRPRTKSEGSSSASDGARLSREELLHELELREGLISPIEHEGDPEEEGPVESGSITIN